jgi:hypothetical protein
MGHFLDGILLWMRQTTAGMANKVLTDSHIYDTIVFDKKDVRLLPGGPEV